MFRLLAVAWTTCSLSSGWAWNKAASRLAPSCDCAQRLAAHHACRANFRLFVLETIITVFGEYVSEYFKIQAVLLLLVNVTMFYTIIRTLPYYSKSINNFQVMVDKHLSLGVHCVELLDITNPPDLLCRPLSTCC